MVHAHFFCLSNLIEILNMHAPMIWGFLTVALCIVSNVQGLIALTRIPTKSTMRKEQSFWNPYLYLCSSDLINHMGNECMTWRRPVEGITLWTCIWIFWKNICLCDSVLLLWIPWSVLKMIPSVFNFKCNLQVSFFPQLQGGAGCSDIATHINTISLWGWL